VDQLACR